MRTSYRTSALREIAGTLFALLLIFTFPIWLPVWVSLFSHIASLVIELVL